MSIIVERFNKIKSNLVNKKANIIAVSKTFSLDHIKPLVDIGHVHFGENKVQEADSKWTNFRNGKNNIKLHMIGKLQSNKAKKAVEIFDYIHSLDNELNVIGLMVIPPNDEDPIKYFKYLYETNLGLGLSELSMGMSADYVKALEYRATFLRIGSSIFGNRS